MHSDCKPPGYVFAYAPSATPVTQSLKLGEGGVVCLRRQALPLRRGVTLIPLGLI